MPTTFAFELSQDGTFALTAPDGRRRGLPLAELQGLVDRCEGEYYQTKRDEVAKLIELGRELHRWLDGDEGWLQRAAGALELVLDVAQPQEMQELNPETRAVALGLTHLPWELLHDGKGFLLQRPGANLTRVVGRRHGQPEVKNRPLRLLLMATAPEDPRLATLSYEREEAIILQATERQPLQLVVEESGSVEELRCLVRDYEDGFFDGFHLTGHGLIFSQEHHTGLTDRNIPDGTPCFVTEDEVGALELTTADDLRQAFGSRWPTVLFLSGCHTGPYFSR